MIDLCGAWAQTCGNDLGGLNQNRSAGFSPSLRLHLRTTVGAQPRLQLSVLLVSQIKLTVCSCIYSLHETFPLTLRLSLAIDLRAMSSSNIHNTAYPASPKNEDTRAIYVGNLPLTISEATLFEIFAILGSIRSIKLIGKSTLNAVNYAFVEYDDPASAETAIETFNGNHDIFTT